MSSNNSRMTMLVAAFAVVIAVVAYFGVKFPVTEDQARGTIAPAERYRGDQISEDDVTLGDQSVSEFMQTDVFQKLVTDEEFAAAMRSEAVQAVVALPQLESSTNPRQ